MIKKWVSIFCFIFMMVTTVVWAKPDSAYIDNGNGTVTDIETRLMWQQRTPVDKMIWYQAMSYCRDLSPAGYKDWRLPTWGELKTLVDSTQSPPKINHTYFPDTVSSFYWSSTTDTLYAPSAWGVAFGNGYGNDYNKGYTWYVRAVRGGQPGSLDNLVISHLSRTVTTNASSTTFGISNTGTGIIPWKASVTAGADWLSISSRAEGTDTGTITCAYTANTSSSVRTGTIRVTAYGATGTSTQKDVTVIQNPPGPTTACTATITATIDGNLLLHIPYILPSYTHPIIGQISWWSDLVNVFDDKNPTLILFKWTKGGLIENPSSFSCEASTSLDNPKIIHIPDVLLPDGITRLWVDLEYSPAFSTAKDDYYEAKNYGIVFSN
jgi:hypothetical protein